jgi:hypothetical protein
LSRTNLASAAASVCASFDRLSARIAAMNFARPASSELAPLLHRSAYRMWPASWPSMISSPSLAASGLAASGLAASGSGPAIASVKAASTNDNEPSELRIIVVPGLEGTTPGPCRLFP